MQTLYTFCRDTIATVAASLQGLDQRCERQSLRHDPVGRHRQFASVVYELERRRHGYDFHTIYSSARSRTALTERNRTAGSSSTERAISTARHTSAAAMRRRCIQAHAQQEQRGNESVLHNFCSLENCTDGADPMAGLTYQGAVKAAQPYDGISPLYGYTWRHRRGGRRANGMSIEPRRKGASSRSSICSVRG